MKTFTNHFAGDDQLHEEVDAEYEALTNDRNLLRDIFPRGDAKVVLPCNMDRMIWNAQKIFDINKQSKSDLLPNDICKSVNELSEKLVIVSGKDRLSIEAQTNAMMLFRIHLRATLCSKRVIEGIEF